jgi:hypothetical protein
MYSATLPYLRNNVFVFDIIKAEKFLFWEWWSIHDTQFWDSAERSKLIVANLNSLRK